MDCWLVGRLWLWGLLVNDLFVLFLLVAFLVLFVLLGWVSVRGLCWLTVVIRDVGDFIQDSFVIDIVVATIGVVVVGVSAVRCRSSRGKHRKGKGQGGGIALGIDEDHDGVRWLGCWLSWVVE